ncbi:MAG: hypothetical protein AB7Q69_10675 [Gemmatimonadales bacterium]
MRNDGLVRILFLALWGATVPAATVAGQGRQASPAPAGLLFGYLPHTGEEARFHEGYRRHLLWHKEKRDSLNWYGWQVLMGERPGVFVDGTFGRPFLAFDRRVDPAGDAADFAATAGPFAAPQFRTALVLLPELGTGIPLETGLPTPFLEVVSYRVRPGTEPAFENLVRSLKSSVDSGAPPITWYRVVSGSDLTTYLMLIHRRALAEWDAPLYDLSSQAARLPEGRRKDALSVLSNAVVRAGSETWRYLPVASLVPNR